MLSQLGGSILQPHRKLFALLIIAAFALSISVVSDADDATADTGNVISIWKPVEGIITTWPSSSHVDAFDIDGGDGETAYLWAVDHPFGSGTFAAQVNSNYLVTSKYRNQNGQTVNYQDRYVGVDIWHTENGQWPPYPGGYVGRVGYLHLDKDVFGPSVGDWLYDGWSLGIVDTLPSAAQWVQYLPSCGGNGAYYLLWNGTPGCSRPYSSGSRVHWSGTAARWPVYHPSYGTCSAWHHFQP